MNCFFLHVHVGSSLIQELRESEHLTFYLLTEFTMFGGEAPYNYFSYDNNNVCVMLFLFVVGLPRVVRYFSKVAYQTINLLWIILIKTQKPSHLIMQVHGTSLKTCIFPGTKVRVRHGITRENARDLRVIPP